LERVAAEGDEFWESFGLPTNVSPPMTFALRSGDKLGLLQITARLQNQDGIKLRYKLVQESSAEPKDISPVIPTVRFKDATLLEALEFFRMKWPINLVFDSTISEEQKSARATVAWENLTALQALTALLDSHGLQLVENPKTGVAKIINKTSFGPVVERELRLDDEVLVHGLDFATGKLTALTRTEYNRTADDGTNRKLYYSENDWVNATSVDMIIGGDTNRFAMAGFESEFKMSALPTEAWATATEAELKAALTQARMQREHFDSRFLPSRDKNWDFLVISNDAQSPQTYAVQARDAYGLLEITAFTENPRGLKFRYKLVQNGNPTNSP
jgi:hypothetical protein